MKVHFPYSDGNSHGIIHVLLYRIVGLGACRCHQESKWRARAVSNDIKFDTCRWNWIDIFKNLVSKLLDHTICHLGYNDRSYLVSFSTNVATVLCGFPVEIDKLQGSNVVLARRFLWKCVISLVEHPTRQDVHVNDRQASGWHEQHTAGRRWSTR